MDSWGGVWISARRRENLYNSIIQESSLDGDSSAERLRRGSFESVPKFGDFKLDVANECLWRGGERLTLTPRPFAVLRYLVENPQRLVTHDELLEALWPETYVQPQVLRTYVLELRRLLGDDLENPQYIATVPKRGYRFLAAVRREGEPEGRNPALIGRDAELEELLGHFARARNGHRATVFLAGEAGIGKTALIDALCERVCAERGGARIARGQCIEGFGGKEALYPAREALAALCSAEDEKLRGVLAAAVPEWFAHGGPGNGVSHAAGHVAGQGTGRGAVAVVPSLSGICEALESLSQGGPLLLVFEDIHRADASTLDLIAVLARRRSAAKLMVLASFRPGDVEARHPLRRLEQNLVTGGCCEELKLGPLGKQAADEFLRGKLGVEALPAGLGSLVHQHSAGNPLYMAAIVDHLRAQKMLRVDEGEAVLGRPLDEIELGVPEGLRGFIELQLDCLSEDDRRLLEAGSISGAIFPAWAAAAALERERDEMEEEYASLARRVRLLSVAGHDELPDGSRSTFFVFAHALYREALYERIPVSRRGRWHRRVADELRALFAGRESRVAHEIEVHTQAGS